MSASPASSLGTPQQHHQTFLTQPKGAEMLGVHAGPNGVIPPSPKSGMTSARGGFGSSPLLSPNSAAGAGKDFVAAGALAAATGSLSSRAATQFHRPARVPNSIEPRVNHNLTLVDPSLRTAIFAPQNGKNDRGGGGSMLPAVDGSAPNSASPRMGAEGAAGTSASPRTGAGVISGVRPSSSQFGAGIMAYASTASASPFMSYSKSTSALHNSVAVATHNVYQQHAAAQAAAQAANLIVDPSLAHLSSALADGTQLDVNGQPIPKRKTIFDISAENEQALLRPVLTGAAARAAAQQAAELAASAEAEARRLRALARPVSFFQQQRAQEAVFNGTATAPAGFLARTAPSPGKRGAPSPAATPGGGQMPERPTNLSMPSKSFDRSFLKRLTPRSMLALKTLGVTRTELLKKELNEFAEPGMLPQVVKLRYDEYESHRLFTIDQLRERRRHIMGSIENLQGGEQIGAAANGAAATAAAGAGAGTATPPRAGNTPRMSASNSIPTAPAAGSSSPPGAGAGGGAPSISTASGEAGDTIGNIESVGGGGGADGQSGAPPGGADGGGANFSSSRSDITAATHTTKLTATTGSGSGDNATTRTAPSQRGTATSISGGGTTTTLSSTMTKRSKTTAVRQNRTAIAGGFPDFSDPAQALAIEQMRMDKILKRQNKELEAMLEFELKQSALAAKLKDKRSRWHEYDAATKEMKRAHQQGLIDAEVRRHEANMAQREADKQARKQQLERELALEEKMKADKKANEQMIKEAQDMRSNAYEQRKMALATELNTRFHDDQKFLADQVRVQAEKAEFRKRELAKEKERRRVKILAEKRAAEDRLISVEIEHRRVQNAKQQAYEAKMKRIEEMKQQTEQQKKEQEQYKGQVWKQRNERAQQFAAEKAERERERIKELEDRSRHLHARITEPAQQRALETALKKEANKLLQERKMRNLERRKRVEQHAHGILVQKVADKRARQVSLDESRQALLRERQMNEKALRTQRDALISNFTRMATSTKFKSLAQTSDPTKKDATYKQLSRQLAKSVRPSTSTINSLRASSSMGALGATGRPMSMGAAGSGMGSLDDSALGMDGSGRGSSGADFGITSGSGGGSLELDANGEPIPPPSAQQLLLEALQPAKQGGRRSASPARRDD